MAHKFHFFRAGGVDQVSLRDGDDLRALPELDQKLWVALAMPVHGVDIDEATLSLLDSDKDGRIHVDDILAAAAWICKTFKDPGDVLTSKPEVRLERLANEDVVATATRLLKHLGKPDTVLTIEDVAALIKEFVEGRLNGDGVVHPDATTSAELARAIAEGVTAVGGVPDRSGKLGLDQAHAELLFAEVDRRAAWLARGKQLAHEALGTGTAPAADALAAVRVKLEDYFTRTRVAAFDPRGATTLGAQEADLVALASRELGATDEALAKLPLAGIDPRGGLPLRAVNPAWAARMTAFETAALAPVLGAREVLTADDLGKIADKLAAFEAWRAEKPTTKADALDEDWLAKLAAPELRDQLAKLIAADLAAAPDYLHLEEVARVVRYQRDFGRVLRNFVNFSDFYMRSDGAFQLGTLYFDARELRLCMLVGDAARHAALDAGSDAYLLYLDTTRDGKTVPIVVALTNGSAEDVAVGRNGLFYDRKGDDWDAVVTKVVTNPISVREAFWSPYKRVVKVVEDQIAKRAAKADAEANAKLEASAKETVDEAGVESEAEKAGAKNAAAAAPAVTPATAPASAAPAAVPAEPEQKVDLGTVAAIGVALGGIGTLFGTLLGTMFGLGPWLPVGLFALVMMISGPSMLLAWLKLRRRNLGPLLDANGWAINSRARINVPFGATMTRLPEIPKGSTKSGHDPYADRRRPWKVYFAILAVVALGLAYYFGRLDRWIPKRAKSTTVLGRWSPSYEEPATPAPAPAAATGSAAAAAAGSAAPAAAGSAAPAGAAH